MFALFTLVSALVVAAAPNKRNAGSIVAPTAGAAISSGSVIPFNYVDLNWCHEGYTPITVYLSETEPTGLNATGGVTEYIASFGPYLIPNFGLAPLPGWEVPPQSLTMPVISAFPHGSALYLSVVETAQAGTCPPGNQPAQYQFSTTSLIVA
ncbi:hypothetical protein C8R45DRAFT_965500 [Mycena sanguinolenta]|nr:hypothetical protein C8R45DRAFT_965500 [Mycena sanguinolenta]